MKNGRVTIPLSRYEYLIKIEDQIHDLRTNETWSKCTYEGDFGWEFEFATAEKAVKKIVASLEHSEQKNILYRENANNLSNRIDKIQAELNVLRKMNIWQLLKWKFSNKS